jgi:enoyl-CoA hydratase/carnithine racemase
MEKTMTVKYEIDGAVGVVTLAKPPHNLLDDALLEDLMTAYQTVVAKGARAILLRSSMRHFCAGAEVQSFGTTTVIHTDKEKFARLTDVLENVPVPTVAALNGAVVGGGLEIALSCDMILAADTAFRSHEDHRRHKDPGERSGAAWHGGSRCPPGRDQSHDLEHR